MNKKLIILYVAMIIIGLVMLLANNSQVENVDSDKFITEVIPEPPKETITIAVARRDLPAKTLLTESDFQIISIEVSVQGNEKIEFALPIEGLLSYGLKDPIQKDAYIPARSLISPSSQRYLQLIVADDMYIYPFTLSKTDNYLLNNLNQGDLIDIYVLYGAEVSSNFQGKMEVDLVSPSNKFTTTRIKPIIVGRRVLLVERSEEIELNGVLTFKEGSRLSIELSNQEIKLIKGLESNAKLLLFPSHLSINDININPLSDSQEENWPVSTSEIFSLDEFYNPGGTKEIIELRGK